MVNLLKILMPFKNYNFKIQWEIHFFTFLNIDRDSLKKKLEYKYGHSYFKSAFGISFGLREVVKRKIRKYMYLRIFRLAPSQSPKLIPKADLKWECPYFYCKFF